MNTLERPRRLRDVVRDVMRTRRYSQRTETTYWYWIRYFIRFHSMSHPRELGETDVQAFPVWLAVERGVAASTQNQALNALVFLYGKVLENPLGDFGKVVRAQRPRRLPTVLSHGEARAVIGQLLAPYDLRASLMYGAGLRLATRRGSG